MNAAATFHCHNPCVQSRALKRTAMVSRGQEQRAIDMPERYRSDIGSAVLFFLIMTYMHRPVANWCSTGFVLHGRDNRTDNDDSFALKPAAAVAHQHYHQEEDQKPCAYYVGRRGESASRATARRLLCVAMLTNDAVAKATVSCTLWPAVILGTPCRFR